MEGLISAVFIVLGWFASAIEWWAYILQTAILFIGYAMSPIFIGMLAFPSLQNTGRTYLLNLLGIMLWPLGWGVRAPAPLRCGAGLQPSRPCGSFCSFVQKKVVVKIPFPFVGEWLAGILAPAPTRRKPSERARLWGA
jgi:hypothetical protein